MQNVRTTVREALSVLDTAESIATPALRIGLWKAAHAALAVAADELASELADHPSTPVRRAPSPNCTASCPCPAAPARPVPRLHLERIDAPFDFAPSSPVSSIGAADSPVPPPPPMIQRSPIVAQEPAATSSTRGSRYTEFISVVLPRVHCRFPGTRNLAMTIAAQLWNTHKGSSENVDAICEVALAELTTMDVNAVLQAHGRPPLPSPYGRRLSVDE